MSLIWIALGGALGAVSRHLAVIGAGRAFGPGFPSGVLLVNVAGSFAMGLAAALLLERAGPGTGAGRFAPFVLAGFLGGFTTFSAFSLDFARLWEAGRLGAAALYAGGSVMLSLLALFAGLALGRAAA
ncbi:MAG: fluoride efflux transporter FluC [Pikeienuella sp.]|uniref:fluoride efflux transporter FluC n=1 Tax=Pikeienuella sp. TaxID=2831957 RepID=UPI00391873BF